MIFSQYIHQKPVFFCTFITLQKSLLLLILALTLLGAAGLNSTSAHAEISKTPSIGLAHYGMLDPEWPCDIARRSERHLHQIHQAVLWNTFGTNTSCLQRYLEDTRLATLEIHLINEVCQRNNRCGDYEFLSGISKEEYERLLLARDQKLLTKLHKYIKPLQEFLKTHLKSTTTCLISPGLESNLGDKAASILINEVRALFPQCQMVWNPYRLPGKVVPFKNVLTELHRSDAKLKAPCVANLDGEDISFPNRNARLPESITSDKLSEYIKNTAHCKVSYLWIAEFNGLNPDGTFLEPRSRAASNFPSEQTFRLLAKVVKQLQEEFAQLRSETP
jgi:hypothetical protein